jgi:hypothetical protein
MSNSKLTLTNITFTDTDSNNSIIVGELSISTEAPGSINVPPTAVPVHSHVILQKNDDTLFKNLMVSSPVNPFPISMYDQRGFLCNKWDGARDNNNSGNVRITTENLGLFSNIVFPNVPDGEQTYLVINSYSGFESCYMQETKKTIIEKDIDMLVKKVDVSKIIIFIAEDINKQFIDIGVDLTSVFKSVHSFQTQKLINYFCEYIAGKNVCGSKPSFQGMLKFDTNADVSVGIFSRIEGEHLIDCQVRRNGRIQINTSNLTSSIRFFILLKHESNKNICITEETTGSSFPIVLYTSDKLVGLTETHLKTIITSFDYYNNLIKLIDFDKMIDVITTDPVITMLYIFKNPLNDIELIVTEDKYSQMIIEYSSSLRKQFINFYNTTIARTNVNISHSDMCIRHVAAIQSQPSKSDLYPIRHSSVPY